MLRYREKAALARRVTELVKASPLPRKEIAQRCQVADGSIGQMMYGKGNPTLDSIVKLAQFFKIPVVDLLREDAERNQPIAQEPLALYHADGPTNRLLSAFAQLTTADQDEFVLAMEQRAAKNAEILRELTSRGSPAAPAFKPALPDREVERRLKLHEKPR